MRIRRAFHRFGPDLPRIIDLTNVDLNWSGLATLAGPSGSGKTTLFRLMSGWYRGPESACTYDPELNRYREVRFVGAQESLLPWKSVGGNFNYRGISRETAIRALDKMELPREVLNMRPYELSYGMYKRVELAIAVHDQPELLLLDEFFTSIDDAAKVRIREYLSDNRGDRKTWVTVHEQELRNWLSEKHFYLVIDELTRCVTGILPSKY